MVENGAVTPRWSLCALCGLYGACLLWCAVVLPWRSATVFSVLTGSLGLLNLAVALLAGLRQRWLAHAWRWLAWGSVGYFLWLSWQVVTSAVYLQRIYGSLGQGIALLLGLALVLFGGITLPVAVWWFVRQRRELRTEKRLAAGAALLFVVSLGVVLGLDRLASSVVPAPELTPERLAAALKRAPPTTPEPPPRQAAASLFSARAAECGPLGSDRAVGVVSFTEPDRGVSSVCVRAEPDKLLAEVTRVVQSRAGAGPVKLDLVTRVQRLRPQPGPLGPLVDSLSLRPGLDGICFETRCLMPWQLVAHGVFAQGAPLALADQLKLGASVSKIRSLVGAPPSPSIEGLLRIETRSLVVLASGVARRLVRGAQIDREPTRANLKKAVRAALTHIRRAQQNDGAFRYEFDMFSGKSVLENPSIPRHAGTTLILCELSEDDRQSRRLVGRALAALTAWERRQGGLAALVKGSDETQADLGSSALGLVALLECRPFVGAKNDGLIGRLGRMLLKLQDDSGRFLPAFDWALARVVDGPTPLFAGGQAIFALSLLEKLATSEPSAQLPTRATLREAVERGMDYVAERYWPSPLADFFYLKENWHCLAARASLGHHRHDGYERFCLDYVEFKTRRFVVDATSNVDPDYYGGFNFSNLAPPHNGSSAGVGEALAAAIEIKRARGEDSAVLAERLRSVLGFLLQRQMLEDNCFACEDPRLALGGFTGESVGSDGRIDHVQHALSALSDGARQLALN